MGLVRDASSPGERVRGLAGGGSSPRRTILYRKFPASRELTGANRRIWAQTAVLTAESIDISEG
jgi:hypothetical protein